MRTELELVFETYGQARSENFGGHTTAEFVRSDLRSALADSISDAAPDFVVEASAGKGNWADTPWVAILDPLVTNTAQDGVYIVYFFSSSMNKLYLSLNQGITRYRDRFGATSGKSRLRHVAEVLRRAHPQDSAYFDRHQINLDARSASSLSSFYEAGHIFGKGYGLNLPDEAELQRDLDRMIRVYRQITFSGIPGEVSLQSHETWDDADRLLESNDRISLHSRIERNPRIAIRVKEPQGTVCRACGFDYREGYGELGDGFIEAHHNTPLAELPRDRAVPLDPRTDFTVLCANCHRMVHRNTPPLTLTELREIIHANQA
jgi:5-methylcytosine-specific restriction protein A